MQTSFACCFESTKSLRDLFQTNEPEFQNVEHFKYFRLRLESLQNVMSVVKYVIEKL